MTGRMSFNSRYLKAGAPLILTSLLFAGVANAAGYGGYIGLDYTQGEVEFDLLAPVIEFDLDHERSAVDFGFVWDTNLARDRLFNYRLRFGIQAGTRKFEAAGTTFLKQKTVGFALNNTFGFGIVRTRSIRLWMGPSIRLAVDFCTSDNVGFCSDGLKSQFVAFGAGPEIGLNWNIGRHLTIGPSLSYNYMVGRWIIREDSDNEPFSGPQHQISVLFNIFFRTGSDHFDQ